MHVLAGEGGAVEAVPEPEERLDPCEADGVDVGVILGLEVTFRGSRARSAAGSGLKPDRRRLLPIGDSG
jgi:hypothetical protein